MSKVHRLTVSICILCLWNGTRVEKRAGFFLIFFLNLGLQRTFTINIVLVNIQRCISPKQSLAVYCSGSIVCFKCAQKGLLIWPPLNQAQCLIVLVCHTFEQSIVIVRQVQMFSNTTFRLFRIIIATIFSFYNTAITAKKRCAIGMVSA